MKTALVLGGTQLFGKRLVQLLLDNGIEVTIATRGKTVDAFGDKVKRLIIERTDRDSIKNAIGDQRWDVLYDQTCFSSQEAQDSVDLFSGKVGRYIFTSTMAVYEFGTEHKEQEFDPYRYPIQLKQRDEYKGLIGYREAKRQAEAVLFQKADFPVTAVRFTMVVGEDDYTKRFKFHVDHVKNETEMTIPDLSVRLSYIYAGDAAAFLYLLGKSTFEGPINAASTGNMSLKELINRIERKADKTARIVDKGDNVSPYAFPDSLAVDNTKAREIGMEFKSLEKVIDDLIDFYLQ